jgi:hypothetical protein
MGDVGVVLRRQQDVQAAFGAIDGMLNGTPIVVEPDPRVRDDEYRGWRSEMGRADVKLVWIDPGASDLKAQMAELDPLPPEIRRVYYVVRTNDPAEAHEINRRVMYFRAGGGSRTFAIVPESIPDRAGFLDYLASLPPTRPADLFLRFRIGAEHCDVVAGESGRLGGWDFFVAGVMRIGLPGEPSQYGVVRTHLSVTREMLAATSKVGAAIMDFC